MSSEEEAIPFPIEPTIPQLHIKSTLLEIERKYKSSLKEWDAFVAMARDYDPVSELEVDGPDTYYQKDDIIIRWRVSQDVSELTIKSRYSLSTSLIREEAEIELEDNSPRHVISFLDRLGFKKLFRIRKECHIFWFKNELGPVCAVIYRVQCRGQEDRYFIELEAEKGMSVADSKRAIRFWEKKFDLPAHKRLNDTLFEIYSGKTTRLVDKRESAFCIKCSQTKSSNDFYPSWIKKSGSKCKECCIKENSTPEALEKVRLRTTIRRKTDLSFKLKMQIRNRINMALKNKGARPASAITGLGCTIEDLKKYLESKFYVHPKTNELMTWLNWGWGPGKWQIDHIKPLHSFDMTDRTQFLLACHFVNLQPLWFEDHVTKINLERK